MPDVFTTTATSNLDQKAYDRAVDYALRDDLYFVQCATKRPTAQAMPGTSVVMTIMNDLAAQVTELTETVDVDAIGITDAQIEVFLKEYGAAVMSTQKLHGTAYVPFDPIKANLIARNAAISLDTLAVTALNSGGTAITSATTMKAVDIREAGTVLQAASAAPWQGDSYVAFMHPHVAMDFKSDTDASAWVHPANYSDAQRRWTGEIGTYDGIHFIISNRVPTTGSGASRAYTTLVLGQDALAMVFSNQGGWTETPQVVVRPPVDKLMRLFSLGWKWLGGFGRYRDASLVRITSTASINS